MNWYGSGFVPIIIYASTTGVGAGDDVNALLTENNLNILTENSQFIDTEN